MRYCCTIVPIFGPVVSETIEADSLDDARSVFSQMRNIDEEYIRVEPAVAEEHQP